MKNIDYTQCPLLVIWEVTRACALACRHCRACAEDRRHPDELTTEEGKALIRQIHDMGTPLLVLTGGDPLQRDDLEELIAYGRSVGLRVAGIPAATPRLTRDRVFALKEAGLQQMALSLDGPDRKTHDDFRKVEGTFDRAMEGAAWAHEAGIPLQVNTVFGAWNARDFDNMAALVESLGIVFWEVFFLVPTGRGAELRSCSPDEMESLFGQLHDMAKRVDFTIKVTEAPQYRRYVVQHGGMPRAGHGHGHGGVAGLSPKPVNAGRGFCFIDHTGDICPSGFLPLVRGNVRTSNLADVYRSDKVFGELREDRLLKGKCGICEFRAMCSGGSRARAFALTGDYLAEEPVCAHIPQVQAQQQQ